MECRSTPVCRNLFDPSKQSQDEEDFPDPDLLRDLHQDDIRILEDLILRFSIGKPLPAITLDRCIDSFQEAQALLLQEKYGFAIARFKNIVEFAQSLPFDNTTEAIPVGGTVFARGLAHERIAFCQLRMDNAVLCLKHAHRSIVETPHSTLPHLWRAIGHRRRHCTHEALKSLTVFAAISEINPDDCHYAEHEQCVINKYWRIIFDDARTEMPNMKTFFMEIRHLAHLDNTEQAEAMSEMILDVHPTYNALIHSDANSIHCVPEEGDSTSYFCSTSHHRQAFSFRDPELAARYFAKLPNNVGYDAEEDQTFHCDSAAVREIWEASSFINSTNPKVSLESGKSISEHIHYCMALVEEQEWYEVLLELGSIQADLSIFSLLSEREWTPRHESEVDETTNRVTDIVQLIERGLKETSEANSQIHQTVLWLEECERRFRSGKCKQSPLRDAVIRRRKKTKSRGRKVKSSLKA